MCEIEHFVKENEKNHPKFVNVKDLKIPLFPQHQQLNSGKVFRPTRHCKKLKLMKVPSVSTSSAASAKPFNTASLLTRLWATSSVVPTCS